MAEIYLAFISTIFVIPLLILIFLFFIVRPRGVKVPIKGRHVFITGGSSGIGLSLAHLAIREGARVSILARNKERLEEARNEIRLATGIEVSIYSVDVRDFDAVKKAIRDAGPIDLLVCNQGFSKPLEFEKQEIEDIKFMIDVNLMGTIHLIKAALPGMKNREDKAPASISITSSQAGQVGIYGYAGYAASKFGLRGIAESLQQEIIMDNIHVSLIFPPDTETPGFIEENKMKPQLTSMISASSGGMNADEVAKKALEGIKSGSFIVPCNFEGFLLALTTAGLSPQRSYIIAFVEVISASMLRMVALCFQWNWYSSIEKWQQTREKK